MIVDAKVLSGNHDDKTYNNETLDDVEAVLERLSVSKDDFYYIADSALFTEKNIVKAQDKGIQFITRAPGTVNITNELKHKAWENTDAFMPVTIKNAHNEDVEYSIQESTGSYKGVECKFTVWYSKSLEYQKHKTMVRNIIKEQEHLSKLNKGYAKRPFVCEEDAKKEIVLLDERFIKEIRYHSVGYTILCTEEKKPGRPKENKPDSEKTYVYTIDITTTSDQRRQETCLQMESTFVLVSNDLVKVC